MAARRVLGELNIQNLSEQNLSTEQEQSNARKNKKRSIPEQSLPEQEQTNAQKNKRTKKSIPEQNQPEQEQTDAQKNKRSIPIKEIPDEHVTETKAFSEVYKSQFSQWYLELRSGFNILFYGYGPKKELLEEFAEVHLRDQPLIVIDGLCSKLDIKDTFMQIIDGVNIDVGTKPGTRASVEKLTTLIREYFSNSERDFQRLNIVIHNIDGPNLCTLQIQNCLSILASCPNICLVASVDHTNATLLFDQDRTAKFNWVWHNTSALRVN